MTAPGMPAKRRKLDPSPAEMKKARERVADFAAKYGDDAVNMVTFGYVKGCLSSAAESTGVEVWRHVREARAMFAARGEWWAA